jgi:enoyl-CoA hydratase
MPEVGIGFFPDVGVSFLLARAPGATGTHLALTGDRMTAADAIHSGLADIHIAAAKRAELERALADCRDGDAVSARLEELSTRPSPSRLLAGQDWIDRCYGAARVEDILTLLRNCPGDDARAARDAMGKASPTSLKITLRNLRAAASFERVEQSFQQDYRIAMACIAGHDFIEGIRAAIVDKDRNPRWRPDTIEAVTPDIVERHFRPVGARELQFEN